MSSEVATQTPTPNPTQGAGRRGNKPRSRGAGNANRGGSNRTGGNTNKLNEGMDTPVVKVGESHDVASKLPVALSENGDVDVCWICAEQVKYYAVSECNHRTCHVCALRLRALYKKMECTFCKETQNIVIFTKSPDAVFSSYTPESIPHKDSRLSISFETEEMMEECLLLLRFNCPDSECDYMGGGWGDLRLHARATHGKLMCDLCIRQKKVFSHEHTLYLPGVLALHLPSMNLRPSKSALKEQIDGGVHPICAFCRECFFGDDELYAHMRERHEECFVCKRNEVRDQYFQNYESLEKHFTNAHFPCTQSECQARKFVVFNTALDLKAHMVEEHGGDMSARDKKDARRIPAEFTFENVGQGGRHGHGGGRRDRERDRDRDREREPPPHQQQQQQQASSSTPVPAAAPATRPLGGRRREGFGAALTQPDQGVSTTTTTTTTNAPARDTRPTSPQVPTATPDIDPAVAERHASFLARLQSLALNPSSAVPAVKSATRSYRLGESTSRDLILTIWNVVDRNLEHTASLVNAFIDLLEEEEKKQDLLASWKGFAIEQRRQFPDLVPTSIGEGYAGITSGRVLNAKHSTATRSSQSQQVWNRVALAASSSGSNPSSMADHFPPPPTTTAASSKPVQERFPSLGNGSGSTSSSTAPRPGQRATPWSASSATPPSLRTQATVVSSSGPAIKASGGRSGSKQAPPKLSNSLFPELPTSSSSRASVPQVKGNVSLKNILGASTAPAVAAWGAGSGGGGSVGGNVNANAPASDPSAAVEGEGVQTGQKAGKKGKGKQKQTLFTLGSFPT